MCAPGAQSVAYRTKAQCSSYGLDCDCKATSCNGAASAMCQKCLGVGHSRTLCHSFGLDCGCGAAPSGHRALGSKVLRGRVGSRRTPAVAVSVSIEETSSAHSKFDVLLSCLGAAKSRAAATACHSAPTGTALGR